MFCSNVYLNFKGLCWEQAKLQIQEHSNPLKKKNHQKLLFSPIILALELHKSKIPKYQKQTCPLQKVTTLKSLVPAKFQMQQ